MIRSSLAAASVALALTAPAWPALAFDPPTAAEFFGRFEVPDYVTVEVQDDGSVLVSAPEGHDGRVMFTLLEHEVPPPGARSVSVEVTMLADGGGWPDDLVGFGMIHGYDEGAPGVPFSVGVVSPQDGGTLRVGSHTGNGFSIPQAIGGSLRMGEPMTLTMAEENGMLSFTVKTASGSSQTQVGNALVSAGMEAGRVGFILVSGGTYRIDNLVIEESR